MTHQQREWCDDDRCLQHLSLSMMSGGYQYPKKNYIKDIVVHLEKAKTDILWNEMEYQMYEVNVVEHVEVYVNDTLTNVEHEDIEKTLDKTVVKKDVDAENDVKDDIEAQMIQKKFMYT